MDKKHFSLLYCLCCYKETIIKGMTSFYTGSNVQYIRVPDGIFLFELRRCCTERRYSVCFFTILQFRSTKCSHCGNLCKHHSGQNRGLGDGEAHAEIKKKRPVEMSSLNILKIICREIV